jgi:hypothetical protein
VLLIDEGAIGNVQGSGIKLAENLRRQGSLKKGNQVFRPGKPGPEEFVMWIVDRSAHP